MNAQDYDELQRPLPSGRSTVKIEMPEDMAWRVRDAECPAYEHSENRPGLRTAFRHGARAGIRARDAQVLSVLMSALSSADPFPMLRALAADLGGEQGETATGDADQWGRTVERCRHCGLTWVCPDCDGIAKHPSPPTLPGPTEHADMALRFRFQSGVFVHYDGSEMLIARPEHYRVNGLSIRIVYEHTKADAAAALDCAESWQARMMGAGAREVVVMGEEVGHG